MDTDSNSMKNELRNMFEPFQREEKSAVVRDTVEMLIKITKNALNSKEEKYKQIKVKNATFSNTVWQHYPCRKLLLSVGWIKETDEEGNDIIRLVSCDHLRCFLEFLVDQRIMKPKDEESEYMKECVSSREEKKKSEEEKRRRIEESKELARKVQEEKKERQRLGDIIKQEIKADREYRNIRRPKSDRELLDERGNRNRQDNEENEIDPEV